MKIFKHCNSFKFAVLYYLFIILSCIFRSPQIQIVFLIVASFLLIGYMNEMIHIEDKKVNYVSIIIVSIFIILIFANYYDAVSLGFHDGLLHGYIGGEMHSDTWHYFYESETLKKLLQKGMFKTWISGKIIIPHEYGVYNFFVIWNTLLRFIFGDSLISLIIIKLQFSIVAIYLLYDICVDYLKPNYTRMAVLFTNLFPGYIMVTINLLRDNIIYFFVICASHIVIKAKNSKKMNKIILFKFIVIIGILTYLRIYIGVAVGAALIIFYLYGNMNTKNLILYSILALITVIVIGKITEKMGYGFLGSNILRGGEDALDRWHSQRASSPIKLLLWSLYTIFAGGRVCADYLVFYSLTDILNRVAPLFITIFILPTLLIFFINKDEKDKNFVLFSLCISIFTGGIIYYIFTAIVPRLYICWLWSQIILFGYILQGIKDLKRNLTSICNLLYCTYILFVFVGYMKY